MELYCWEKDRNIRRETYPVSSSSITNSIWNVPGANLALCVEKQMLTTRNMASLFFLLCHNCPFFWSSFSFETPNNATAVLHVRYLNCTVQTEIKYFFNTAKHNRMLCIKFGIILRVFGRVPYTGERLIMMTNFKQQISSAEFIDRVLFVPTINSDFCGKHH